MHTGLYDKSIGSFWDGQTVLAPKSRSVHDGPSLAFPPGLQALASRHPIDSAIMVHIPCRVNYADAAHLPALLDTYLHRSKNVPLTLTILLPLTFGSTGTPSPTKTITEEQDQAGVVYALLQKTTESQKRWKDVVLGMIIIPRDPMDPSAPVNFTIRLGEMKALNQLTIVESLGSVFPGSRRIVLGQCPQLETIKLVGPLEVIDAGSSEQRVAQADYFPKLRSINLSDFKHKHCWKFLQYASHAEDLVLNFFEHLDDVVGSPFLTGKPLLELPKLRSVFLHSNAEDRNATQILNHLSLPSLTILKMQNRMLCDDTFTDLSVALDRFRLTHFKIRGVRVRDSRTIRDTIQDAIQRGPNRDSG